jgi:hypothetical protein
VSTKLGGREVGRRENFQAEKRLKKPTTLGREDVFLVHLKLVHWWLLIHSIRERRPKDKVKTWLL